MERSKTLVAGGIAFATTAAYALYRWRTAVESEQSVESPPQAD